MSGADRFIRLFDLAKYREIQPITDGINKGTADPKKVIKLLTRSMDIVQSSEFKKYSSDIDVESYILDLEEGLEIMHEEGLSGWRRYLCDRLNVIISSICCPRYQYSSEYEEVNAKSSINYAMYSSCLCDININLYEILDNGCVETLPNEHGDSVEWVLTRQDLMELAAIVKKDLVTFSQPDFALFKIISGKSFVRFSTSPRNENLPEGYSFLPAPEIQSLLLEFYQDFDCLLEEAIANPDYTVINQACLSS